MASYKIIILESAITDISDSCIYYNKAVSGLGFEFEEEVFRLLQLIKQNPFLFPIKFANIHEAVLSTFPFVINYELLDKIIVVTAVFHTRQKPVKKINRKKK